MQLRKIILIFPVLIFLINACCTPQRTTYFDQSKIDSTLTAVRVDSIYIRSKPEIIFRNNYDTITIPGPFQVKFDTIIKNDTFNLGYTFPENIFEMFMHPEPDSIFTKVLTVTKTVFNKNPWWELPAIIVGSLLIGLIVGYIIKAFR